MSYKDSEVENMSKYEISGEQKDIILSCKNITKSYKDKEVLHGVDLDLERGKIYGLIGRNGAGKTTLLSILSAQKYATKGTVEVDGEPVWENENALSKICFSRELNPMDNTGFSGFSVKKYLHAAEVFYPNWDREMADRLVKEFKLDPKQKFMKLSKGMLSMVTIIVALASNCEITFLDEPVAGLDVFMRDKFYKLLLDEFMETQRTFVISTHIIDEASNVFEDVIIIKDGDILLKENTQELLDRVVHVSGKADDVDAAVNGLEIHRVETLGRSKGVTVILKEGEKIPSGYDVDIANVSLQNAFLALCGDDNE